MGPPCCVCVFLVFVANAFFRPAHRYLNYGDLCWALFILRFVVVVFRCKLKIARRPASVYFYTSNSHSLWINLHFCKYIFAVSSSHKSFYEIVLNGLGLETFFFFLSFFGRRFNFNVALMKLIGIVLFFSCLFNTNSTHKGAIKLTWSSFLRLVLLQEFIFFSRRICIQKSVFVYFLFV